MAIVYRHIDNNNKVFYIGIGKNESRAFDYHHRSNFWKRYSKKHGVNTEVIIENISFDDAKELEMLLISEYGRKDLKNGNLVNMTDGGEGSLNRIQGENEKEKRANSLRGKKRTIEQRKTMSDARKGIVFSEEHLKNLSESHKGNCSANAFKVKHIETKEVYRSLREGCIKCNLKYKTEHMRMKRNPNSPKNKFIFI